MILHRFHCTNQKVLSVLLHRFYSTNKKVLRVYHRRVCADKVEYGNNQSDYLL